MSFARPGIFEVGFDVTNGGRLPITLQGLGSPTSFNLGGMGRVVGMCGTALPPDYDARAER